jgi:hypothetical protein
MSTSPAKRTAPLACTRCDDEDGPFTAYGLCEECETETASALRGLPVEDAA